MAKHEYNCAHPLRQPRHFNVEVIALLAKQELAPFLEAAFNGRGDDQVRSQPQRSVQRQRRLSQEEILNLANRYVTGSTVRELAQIFGIHRTTVLVHLERQGIERRRRIRRLTDAEVEIATRFYRDGQSLKTTANHFAVDPETLRREFKKAGVTLRRRQGWEY